MAECWNGLRVPSQGGPLSPPLANVLCVKGRKFPGYSFWFAKDGVKRRVADKPMATFRQRVRRLIRLGAAGHVAKGVAQNARRWEQNSHGDIEQVLTLTCFDRLGVPRIS